MIGTIATLHHQFSTQRLAQLAIAAELLASLRTLAEIFRRRGEAGFDLDAAVPYLTGAIIAVGFVAASVLCYFAGRERSSGLLGIVMVVVLIGYKLVALPGG